jgi:hypothetical protein
MRSDAGAAVVAMAAVLTAAVALPAEPAYLSADAVRALIVGNTVEVQEPSGTTFRVYFDADGRRLALQGNAEYALPWRILPDGNQCVTTADGDDCARIARNADGTYSRRRDGSTVYRWLRILPGKVLTAAVPAPGIYSRQTGTDKYEVAVVGPTLTERRAREQVASTGASLCKALVAVPGAFRFEATEPVAGEGASGGQRTFQYRQVVACVARAAAPVTPAARQPTMPTAEESRGIQQQIRARTEAYFRLLAANRLDEAYAQMDARALGQDEQAWKRSKQSFQALAGEPVQLSISKITVYDNPAEAREPGLYVAADYSNEYRNVPVHCGYLIWFRPIGGGDFRVTREETGHITAEQHKSIPAAQLPAIKRSLRCTAP